MIFNNNILEINILKMNECIPPERSFWNYNISQMYNNGLIIIISYNANLDVVYFYYKLRNTSKFLFNSIIKQKIYNKRSC